MSCHHFSKSTDRTRISNFFPQFLSISDPLITNFMVSGLYFARILIFMKLSSPYLSCLPQIIYRRKLWMEKHLFLNKMFRIIKTKLWFDSKKMSVVWFFVRFTFRWFRLVPGTFQNEDSLKQEARIKYKFRNRFWPLKLWFIWKDPKVSTQLFKIHA